MSLPDGIFDNNDNPSNNKKEFIPNDSSLFRKLLNASYKFKLFYFSWFIINLTILLTSGNLSRGFFHIQDRFFPLYLFSYYPNEWYSHYDISEFAFYMLLPLFIFFIVVSKRKNQDSSSPFRKIISKLNFHLTGKVLKIIASWVLILGIVTLFVFEIYDSTIKNSAREYLREALDLKKAKKYDEAKSKLELAIKTWSSLPNAHYELGLVMHSLYAQNKEIAKKLNVSSYGDIGLYQVAKLIEKEIELDSNNLKPYVELKDIYFEMGYGGGYGRGNYYDYNKAIDICNYLITKGTELEDSYGVKGVSFYNMEKYEDAIINYYSALSISKNKKYIYEYMGDAYFWNENYLKAVEYYEQADKLSESRSYFWFGSAYYKIGNKMKQLENYKIAANLGYQPALDWFNRYNLKYK